VGWGLKNNRQDMLQKPKAPNAERWVNADLVDDGCWHESRHRDPDRLRSQHATRFNKFPIISRTQNDDQGALDIVGIRPGPSSIVS
jgi:hypothetical protein